MGSLVTSELFRLLPRGGWPRCASTSGAWAAPVASTATAGVRPPTSPPRSAAMEGLWPQRPLVLCGWSFGADVSLSLADPRIDGWVGIAPPLRILPVDELTAAAGADPRPSC